MKIVIVHNKYLLPGGEDHVFNLEATLLNRYSHKVVKYVRDFHNTFPLISPSVYSACVRAGVPVIQTLHNFRLICPAATLFRDGQVCEDCLGRLSPWPGIRHACYRKSRLQTSIVAGMLMAHNWHKTYKNNVDRYIALTKFGRQKFIEGGLPAEKIVVKPNFIYPDPGQGEERNGYALFVGRTSKEKGILTLLRAWSQMAGHPLKIVGNGELRSHVETYIEREKLNDIEVLGQRKHEDVLKLMKAARLLIFPSVWYEGFPVTIVEAFATGLPVVASRLGSMEEIIEEDRTGILFKPGDEVELAEKIAQVWAHPRILDEMGKEARLEYERKYTAETNYQQLIKIYESAISS